MTHDYPECFSEGRRVGKELFAVLVEGSRIEISPKRVVSLIFGEESRKIASIGMYAIYNRIKFLSLSHEIDLHQTFVGTLYKPSTTKTFEFVPLCIHTKVQTLQNKQAAAFSKMSISFASEESRFQFVHNVFFFVFFVSSCSFLPTGPLLCFFS